MPDGRVVLVGGEHEDSYDPDFHIYNDVVVRRPDEAIEIYGYPPEAFPPTDFHSATRVDDRIILIGCLGYPKQRRPGITPVYGLDLQSFRIDAIDCTGDAPGWLHRHDATYLREDDAILVTGGLVERNDPDRPLPENIDDWKLHLGDRRWERLTRRRWQQWDIRRVDGRQNELFWIGSACTLKVFKDSANTQARDMFEKQVKKLVDDLGFRPDLDLYEKLYTPPVRHEKIPGNENEFRVHRIDVNGVVVRYNEDSWTVRITVEGDLPTSTTDAIVSDLVNKVSALERKPYEIIRL